MNKLTQDFEPTFFAMRRSPFNGEPVPVMLTDVLDDAMIWRQDNAVALYESEDLVHAACKDASITEYVVYEWPYYEEKVDPALRGKDESCGSKS